MSVCSFANQSYRYDKRYPSTYSGGPYKGVLHTTESSTLPGYQNGSTAPHFTVLVKPALRAVVIYQHFDTARPARALVNKSGGVQTNRDSAIQIELVGTCDPRRKDSLFYWPTAPNYALDGLARLMRWIEADKGIKRESTPRPWLAYGRDDRRPGITPASYGASTPARMRASEWDTFNGWCGHQHVPENTHGDPGNIDIGYLLGHRSATPAVRTYVLRAGATLTAAAAALGLTLSTVQTANPGLSPTATHTPGTTITAPATAVPRPSQSVIVVPPPTSSKPPVKRPVTTGSSARTLSASMRRGSSGAQVSLLQLRLGLPADGKFGPATERAVRDFQYVRGLRSDGLVGPATRAALSVTFKRAVVNRGDKNRHVGAVQRRLGLRVDNSFGPATDHAVRAYQSRKGLKRDGYVGPATWASFYR